MNLHKKYRKMLALILALAITVSGVMVNFPVEDGKVVQFGGEVEAAAEAVWEYVYGESRYSDTNFDFTNYDYRLVLDGSVTVNGKISSNLYDPNLWTFNSDGNGVVVDIPDDKGICNLIYYIGRNSFKALMRKPKVVPYNYKLSDIWEYVSNGSSGFDFTNYDYRFAFAGNDIEATGYNSSNQIVWRSGYVNEYTVFDVPSDIGICRISNNSLSCTCKVLMRKIKNNCPIQTTLSPTQNELFSTADTNFIPQISVSDADNDTLTCKYYIDAEATPRETKTVPNTMTTQTISFSAINMTTLSEGTHTIKYVVCDSYDSVMQNISFTVDKTLPTLETVTRTSAINSITMSGSATDSFTGLAATPYRYTIGSEVSAWRTGTTYTSSSILIPNTQYATKFEASDAAVT